MLHFVLSQPPLFFGFASSISRLCIKSHGLIYLTYICDWSTCFFCNLDQPNATVRSRVGNPKGFLPESETENQEHHFFRIRYADCFNIFHLCGILIRVVLGLGYEGIREIKQKHVHSFKIMKKLIKITTKAKRDKYDFTSGRNPRQIINPEGTWDVEEELPSAPKDSDSDSAISSKTDQGKGKTPKMTKTETPVLLAARNGITEMVEKILKESPLAINDKSEGKNIVHWAAMNRQPHVLQLLLKQEFVQRKLIHEVDTNNNNALHLAAEIEKKRPWLIPGAALQMQWELKWYEFVKSHMPQHICYQQNDDDKTPEEIFDDSHKDLVKEGGKWLDKTSESCSVVAALVATVAFAASTTIPGNFNEESGSPNLENQPAITIFAISSLVALCFSITSLFTFLSILTSRYEQKDFRRDLPTKLLIGLTSLFVSIASMLVSFCAGHFFLLKNKLRNKAFPVYAVTCLPIVFFAIQQLPLYADILWAIYKKVPRSSNKAVLL